MLCYIQIQKYKQNIIKPLQYQATIKILDNTSPMTIRYHLITNNINLTRKFLPSQLL